GTDLVWPGSGFPLGASFDGVGTNFSIFSEVAEGVELCLLDGAGEERRIPLTEVDGGGWHGYLPGVASGQRYGYRVHGTYAPALQSGEAAARPLRQGGRRGNSLGRGAVFVSLVRSRPDQRRRLRFLHACVRGDQPLLRLGR